MMISTEPTLNSHVPSEVLSLLADILRQAAERAYLFRGEPRGYDKVSSGLYRTYGHIDPDHFLLDWVQQELLDEVPRFAPALFELGPSTTLAHLQHYGCLTNFIDFTADLLVALFFACDGERDATGQDLKQRDGRLVLLARSRTVPYTTSTWDEAWRTGKFGEQGSGLTREAMAQLLPGALEIPEEGTRIQIQKSVLVHAPMGVVEPDCSITIPSAAKDPLLQYLDRVHHLNAATVYHDVHGFIQYHRTHRSHAASFFAGCEAYTQGCTTLAIRRFTEALQSVENVKAHGTGWKLSISAPNLRVRGAVFLDIQNYQAAVSDFSCVLAMEGNQPDIYVHRAVAYMGLQAWDKALGDLDAVGEDIHSIFQRDYRDVPTLESQLHVGLPERIVKCLSPSEVGGEARPGGPPQF